ncbi:unnamed protein product [Caenorhabditis sp. 36 PRJEB53466]|nr:unnamed protein product [Caenorhabditis sp. 36 PRJEB53466]
MIVVREVVFVIVIFLLVSYCLADHHGDSPGDDSPEDHGSGREVEREKEKEKKKKEKGEDYYDGESQSLLADADIDAMFTNLPTDSTKTTKTKSKDSKKEESEESGGSSPVGFWDHLMSGGFDTETAAPIVSLEQVPTTPSPAAAGTTPPSEETPPPPPPKTDDDCSQEGRGGSPFFSIPRPVDIWDRLFALAAFPICFFAVMLKAEMYR